MRRKYRKHNYCQKQKAEWRHGVPGSCHRAIERLASPPQNEQSRYCKADERDRDEQKIRHNLLKTPNCHEHRRQNSLNRYGSRGCAKSRMGFRHRWDEKSIRRHRIVEPRRRHDHR